MKSDLKAIVERIVSRPESPVVSSEDEQQQERTSRNVALRELLAPMGKLHADCRASNYEVEHPGQREVLLAMKDYAANMSDEVAQGNGIVLFGPTGTGKDHLLTALARHAILKHGFSVVWRNGMDLYGEMRDNIRNDKVESSLILQLTKPDILYLSDPLPPVGDLSPYQATMLQRILDARIRQMKPCWVSMNVKSSADADRRMGSALVDRLKPGSLGAFCDWPSHRKLRMVWPLEGKE